MLIGIGRNAEHFALTTVPDEIGMLMATDPECFFQTLHCLGSPAIPVGFAAAGPERVAVLIEQAWPRRASKAQLAARD